MLPSLAARKAVRLALAIHPMGLVELAATTGLDSIRTRLAVDGMCQDGFASRNSRGIYHLKHWAADEGAAVRKSGQHEHLRDNQEPEGKA